MALVSEGALEPGRRDRSLHDRGLDAHRPEDVLRPLRDRPEDEASLRRATSEYVAHYHSERAHQGIGNERIEQPGVSGTVRLSATSASVDCSGTTAAPRN